MIDLRFVPLTKWPGEATKEQQNSSFRASYAQTLVQLEETLRKMKASAVVVEAFFEPHQIKNSGWPYANAEPSESGVILSFRTEAGSFSFPCDRFETFDDNLRAIALSLEALRAVDRYGVTKRAEQYAGWKRIEAPPLAGFASKEDAAAFIAQQGAQLGETFNNRDVIEKPLFRQELYRKAARRLHPDAATGSHELFVKLQQANALLEGAA